MINIAFGIVFLALGVFGLYSTIVDFQPIHLVLTLAEFLLAIQYFQIYILKNYVSEEAE